MFILGLSCEFSPAAAILIIGSFNDRFADFTHFVFLILDFPQLAYPDVLLLLVLDINVDFGKA